MSSIVYHHQVPPGIESKCIQFFMGLFGIETLLPRNINLLNFALTFIGR